MKIISHRGNINGPNKELENTPFGIDRALSLGFDVEIDVWFKDNKWWLGHDEPQYETDLSFISKNGLWVHCKNLEALDKLVVGNYGLEYFWHEEDTVTLTSSNYIWTYPCKPLVSTRSIAVMPELCDNYAFNLKEVDIFGVCTDYPRNYK